MSKNTFPSPPETAADITTQIEIPLDLNNKNKFQFLASHRDGTSNLNDYQVFGCFQGERIIIAGQEKFLLQRYAIKLVNLDPNARIKYGVDNALFVEKGRKTELEISVVKLKKGEPVKERSYFEQPNGLRVLEIRQKILVITDRLQNFVDLPCLLSTQF